MSKHGYYLMSIYIELAGGLGYNYWQLMIGR